MRVSFTILLVFVLSFNSFAQQHKSLQDLRSQQSISLQFDALPSAKEIAKLEVMGIQLTSYLGNRTYEALVSNNSNLDQAKNRFNISESTQRRASLGIAEDIAADNIPSHAKHNNETVDIAVTFNSELDDTTINEFIVSQNARLLRSLANGQIAVLNISKNKVADLLNEPFVQQVEFKDEPVSNLNFENKSIQGAHYVHGSSIPGMELDGTGIVIGVGDGGMLGEHIDFGNKVLLETTEYLPNFGEHGTHVTGTISSRGNLNPMQSGFAPESDLIIERTTNIFYAAREYYDNYGMVLTNNSYGGGFDCEANGAYNNVSFTLDKQLYEMPNLMHVFAAGNAGLATCDGFPKGFKTVLKYYGAAKNVLTVGSVDENLELANSSSRGPAKDGRLKPEICGVGVNVLSNGRDNNYLSMSGTSMAAPSVTGSLALMYQKYEQDNGEVARGDLMKAIICNSADDLGPLGPDYKFGFGLVNTFRAVKTIEDNRYIMGAVENAQKANYVMTVSEGVEEAKFLLYWNDKENTSQPERALVNNLDIEIIAPDGEVILPWVLNHNSMDVDVPASRKVDILNNIEQITIQNPIPGDYQLVVKGTEVPFGPQSFAVAYEMNKEEVLLTFPAGDESLVPDERYAITWMANKANENSFKLEFSIDGGNSWNLIVDAIPAQDRTYKWRTPILITQNAKIRVSMNNTELQHSNETVFNILGKPTLLKAIPVCKETMRLVWQEEDAADKYVVYMLKDGRMEVVGETEQKFIDIEFAFDENTKYWFSVANKMNLGKIGERVTAISATTKHTVECDRDNDGKLIDTRGIKNGRELTEVSLGESSSFGVFVQNNGKNDLSNYDLSMRVNNSGTLKEKYTGMLPSGEVQEYEFNNTFDFSKVGTYAIDTWMSHPLDNLHYNDSIIGQFTVSQLPNKPVSLPLVFDFQENTDFYHYESQIGLGDLTHFDFMKGDNLADSYLESIGNTKYLVLENHEDAIGEANSYIMTLNMTEYNLENNISLSFDSKVYSVNLAKGGEVWIRGSDRDSWIKLKDLANSSDWESSENISIIEVLKENYQVMSTSTQVKFAIESEGMLSIDNVQLNMETINPVADKTIESLVKLYPNIVFNDFTLEIDNEIATSAEIAIVNGNGQIVHEMGENLDFGKNIFNYNEVQNLAPGMYFITIKMGAHTEVKKLTKVSE